MATIIAACEHTGGALILIPVVRELRNAGHSVHFVAGGEAAVKALREANEQFEIHFSPGEVLSKYPAPDALVTSLCSATSLIEGLLKLVQGKCPAIGLQGPAGGGITDAWEHAQYRPGYMCVQEETDAGELLGAWQGFSRDHAWITGFPNLDRYIGYDDKRAALKMRSAYRLEGSAPVVLFAGDHHRTSEELAEVVAALNKIGKEVYLVARPHPRMAEVVPEELAGWRKAISDFKSGRVIDTSSHQDIQPFIALADIVVGRGSTVMMEAAYLRRQVISTFYPEVGAAEYFKDTGRKDFLWVQKGCVAKATNREELLDLLRRAFNGSLGLQGAQEKHLPHNGKTAGKRIAERIVNLIASRP